MSIMGKKDLQTFYCESCQKETKDPKRKPMEGFQKQIWVIVIIATLGFAAIALVVYVYKIKKKKYCPSCGLELKISKKLPEIAPKASEVKPLAEQLRVERIPIQDSKAEKETGEILDPTMMYCPFCGSQIPKTTKKCPNCSTEIEPR